MSLVLLDLSAPTGGLVQVTGLVHVSSGLVRVPYPAPIKGAHTPSSLTLELLALLLPSG
jgi:hypothetical protein